MDIPVMCGVSGDTDPCSLGRDPLSGCQPVTDIGLNSPPNRRAFPGHTPLPSSMSQGCIPGRGPPVTLTGSSASPFRFHGGDRRWSVVGLKLARRRRRWPSFGPTTFSSFSLPPFIPTGFRTTFFHLPHHPHHPR